MGTISFVPSDVYHATLTYSITGGPTVVKQSQRFTLIPVPGPYSVWLTVNEKMLWWIFVRNRLRTSNGSVQP